MTAYEYYDRPPRRRRWRYVILLLLIVAAAGAWTMFWRYAAATTAETIAGWRAREAQLGRIYDCGSQTIGGYPFRIEVTCERASALLRSQQPPVELKTSNILVAAQIYDPTLLISEFSGPLTVAEPGSAPGFVANWKLAQTSVRGTPASPERVSIVLDGPRLDRINGTARENLVYANRIEIHGRMTGGTAANNPVIEIVLRLAQASLPGVHAQAAAPINADITGVLHGLKNFAPKSWAERFREIRAAGGRIEFTQARVAQGETVAVGSGTLALNANGQLDGQMRVTVAGLEPFLNSIGAERFVKASPTVDRIAGALDRLMPGLGAVAKKNAGANISAGVNLLGQQTVLEGKPAVSLPLRFSEGRVYLGPIPIGNAPALF